MIFQELKFRIKSPEAILSVITILLLALKLNTITIAIFVISTLLLSIKYPYILIIAFFCSLIGNNYLQDYGIINLIFFLSFLYVFYILIFSKKIPISFSNFDLLLLIGFLYVILVSWVNDYEGIFHLTAIFITIFIIRIMLNVKIVLISQIILAYLVMFVFSGIVGLKESAFGLSYGSDSVNRFLSSYGDPNFYSLIGFVTILGVINLLKINKINKYLLITIISILCAITYSKTLPVLIIFNIGYFILEANVNILKKFIMFFLTLGLIILGNYIANVIFDTNIIGNYILRIFSESNNSNVVDSLSTGRYSIQRMALSLFFEQNIIQIIFGRGYIGTEKLFQEIGLTVVTAHSVYIQMLIDFGILGIILFMIIFSLGFNISNKNYRPILLTYFVSFFVLSWQFSVPFFLLYIILGRNEQ